MKKYLDLVLFKHSIFALPFAIVGYVLTKTYAGYHFNLLHFILIILCMVFARSAAMAFNRYLDRDIDALNPRTQMRDIPAGRIKARNALIFVIINCVLFIACCAFLNRLTLMLSPIALFIVLFYSYTKRFTSLCHFVLGLGLSLAPIGAYIAVTGRFDWLPMIISLAVLFWTAGFDIIYALQDEAFDREHKLQSIPAWLGIKKALTLSTILHIISGLLIVSTLYFTNFGYVYYLGLIIFCGMLIYQHTLVKPNDLSKVNRAFQTTNGYASMAYMLCFLIDAFIRYQHTGGLFF